MTTEATQNLARWAEAMRYLEAFINARNGRCLPSQADLDGAESVLRAWRMKQSAGHRGAGTPGEFGRPGY